MRPKWAFQLLPNSPGVLGKGYRVDAVTQEVEDEVNALLQCKFEFHGIKKLVIRFGEKDGVPDYHEHIGVAQKYYPELNIEKYGKMAAARKTVVMRSVVVDVFLWIIENFDDAQVFDETLVSLEWNVEN